MAQRKKQTSTANKMWGGHFTVGPAQAMARINECIETDKRLYIEDIAGSMAHAEMLGACQILKIKDVRAIQKGLQQIAKEIEDGTFQFSEALEDVHMNVEQRLADLIGDAAGRLHTARSRNDQVATDIRLWTRAAIGRIRPKIMHLMAALTDQAEKHAATIMPGYTHLQPAQPVTFGHHLLAYIEMFSRDEDRFKDTQTRLNFSPLGAAALAGTSFPIDREMTAQALGFDGVMRNSIDAVSDRDFAMEFTANASICGVHLSRLAEEIVIWMSDAFRFITLSESFTSGSSIMPQKRNPDAAELVRGKAAGLIGQNMQLLTLIKGLPLTYNKDLQDSKPPVIKAADELEMALDVMTGMINDLTANKENMKAATQRGFLTATDLADWLVREIDLPFRQAHHVTGQLVKLAETKNCRLDELSMEEMKKIEPKLTQEIYKSLTPESAIKSRTSLGGTAPSCVKAEIKRWKKKLTLFSPLSHKKHKN